MIKQLLPYRKNRLVIFIILAYAVVFTATYKLIQNPDFYSKHVSGLLLNYENRDEGIVQVNKPFAPITRESLEFGDAEHYSYIRDHLYSYGPHEGSISNFAFFPLFPLTWKICPGFGIVILNFLLHLAAIIILAFVFCRKKIADSLLVILALPTLSVFLFPYTEALFLFLISIALLGYQQKNKYLYIGGLLLASFTRPVFFLFLATAIAVEIFQFIRYKKINYRHLLITMLTVLTGTVLVAALQYCFHPQSPLEFIYIQKIWDTYFRIPKTINDWSLEGYGMNTWALIFCLVTGIIILTRAVFKKIKPEDDPCYWYYFSWIYLVATCAYVLLFQGGCLHSLYRYTLCSPFFYVVILHHLNHTDKKIKLSSLLIFMLFIISSILFYNLVGYGGSPWTFPRAGFLLLTINLFAFIFLQQANRYIKYSSYFILILAAITWNCYLCNMYVTKAWLFL